MNLETLVTLGVFAPLLGAAIVGLSGRRLGDLISKSITTGLLFFSCAVAWIVLSQWIWGGLQAFTVELFPFINVGDFQSVWSIRIDALSAVMLVVVTTVSSLVHLYSWGYMAEDPDKPRFFAYLSLFTFAMLALVTAADFMQLFFGWEGVGLASYLLIGFWFKKSTASAAAIKAFVVNRVGDFGFALGIFTVFWMFGTIEFAELFPMIASKAGTGWEFLGYTWSALDLAGVLLRGRPHHHLNQKPHDRGVVEAIRMDHRRKPGVGERTHSLLCGHVEQRLPTDELVRPGWMDSGVEDHQ